MYTTYEIDRLDAIELLRNLKRRPIDLSNKDLAMLLIDILDNFDLDEKYYLHPDMIDYLQI